MSPPSNSEKLIQTAVPNGCTVIIIIIFNHAQEGDLLVVLKQLSRIPTCFHSQ